MPRGGPVDAFPQVERPAHVVPPSFALQYMTPNGAVPHGFDPMAGSPAPHEVAHGHHPAWSAWKWIAQLLYGAAAVAVAVAGESRLPVVAVVAGCGLLLLVHFALVDGIRFGRDHAPATWEHWGNGHGGGPGYGHPHLGPPLGGPHAAMPMPDGVHHGMVAHRAQLPHGSVAGGVPGPGQQVSVVAPSGMPIAGRWSFVAPEPAPGQAPASNGNGSSIRNSTRSGRLR